MAVWDKSNRGFQTPPQPQQNEKLISRKRSECAALASPMFKSAKHAKMRRWFGILSQYLSVQLIIQGLGFLVGIYVVRTFSKNEYSTYTLANGMQGMLSSLSDVGVGAGVMAIGGRIWQDKAAMGRLIKTALDLRHIFVAVTILAVAPIWAWLIYRNGAGAGYTLLIVVAVVIGVILQLDSLTYGSALRLNSKFREVQKIELQTGVVRAAAVLGLSMVWKSALGVIAVTGASWGLGRSLVLKHISPLVERSAHPEPAYRADLLSQTKSQLPNALFYCFSGQIPVLMISIFGKTSNIAEVGALGRLSALLLIFSNVMTNIIMPSFARCQDANLLKRRYFQILGCFCAFAMVTVLIASLFPHGLLVILGKQYANLEKEVGWMVGASMVQNLCGVMFGLCAAKGWTQRIWINIPMTILAQIATYFLVDLGTVKGVIIFGSLPTLPAMVVYYLRAREGIKKQHRYE